MDLYLKTSTEEEMNELLINVDCSMDRIGPFTKLIGYNTDGTPIEQFYPDYHVNLRGIFSEDELTRFLPYSVEPPVPHRIWA